MGQLKITWNVIKDAFTFSYDEATWHIDMEAGKTVYVNEFSPCCGRCNSYGHGDDRYALIEAPSSGERDEWMVEFV